jgi:hypothetical protein
MNAVVIKCFVNVHIDHLCRSPSTSRDGDHYIVIGGDMCAAVLRPIIGHATKQSASLNKKASRIHCTLHNRQ